MRHPTSLFDYIRKMLWLIHNTLKSLSNVFILLTLLIHSTHSTHQPFYFLASCVYEFIVDPLALAARGHPGHPGHLGHPAPHSLIAHHTMVLSWAAAMTLANSQRTWVIASIATNRIVIYGCAAIRGSFFEHVGTLILPKAVLKRGKAVKAFLSTLQFVVAAFDGVFFAMASSTYLQVTIASSQVLVVSGLAGYQLWLASKRYGVILVDTQSEHDNNLHTLIPLWVP